MSSIQSKHFCVECARCKKKHPLYYYDVGLHQSRFGDREVYPALELNFWRPVYFCEGTRITDVISVDADPVTGVKWGQGLLTCKFMRDYGRCRELHQHGKTDNR